MKEKNNQKTVTTLKRSGATIPAIQMLLNPSGVNVDPDEFERLCRKYHVDVYETFFEWSKQVLQRTNAIVEESRLYTQPYLEKQYLKVA